MIRMRCRSFALVGLLMSGAASAVERDMPGRLDGVEADLSAAEARVRSLTLDYTERRGLIGSEEALSRYEESVYLFLIGEYDRAADSFYTLVKSDALRYEGLEEDSQWYLGESLFELGNWNTALSAYEDILGVGLGHPFFADAVRRELEIYGILRDNDRFYETYRKWILSGLVAPSDAVKYTVAKSFYRQGESARAKSMFSEIPEDSAFFGRARYFLGTMLAVNGEYGPAIEEFKRVLAEGVEDDPAVVEQAHLALGRLYYEVGDYPAASDHYQQVDPNSPYFDDQLYELVWTFIKQERWEEAIQHVEIFLIAFPEHRYAMQLRLNEGHLEMKKREFDSALQIYDGVVNDYGPLKDLLDGLEAGREDPEAFFKRIVDDDLADSGLPPFAVEMLVDQPSLGRVVDAYRNLSKQQKDLEAAKELVEAVNVALAETKSSVGTFRRGRIALAGVRDESLALKSELVRLELSYLDGQLTDPSQVKASQGRWTSLRHRVDEAYGGREDSSGPAAARELTADERHGLAAEFDQLHTEAIGMRRGVADPTASLLFGRVDGLWARLGKVDDAAATTAGSLGETEKKELALVRETLGVESVKVEELTGAVDSAGSGAAGLADKIARDGFAELDREVTATIMAADRGVVDVYWLQKTEAADEITRLSSERATRLTELNNRFRVIRQKLEE